MNGKLAGAGVELMPRTMRKVVVTAVVGSLTYLVTEGIIDKEVESVLLAAFVGGVVFVVQYLVDVDQRLEKLREEQSAHQARMQQMVERGLSRINEATELFWMVEEAPLRTDAITQLVRNATNVGPDTPDLVKGLAQSEIERLSRFLRDLGERREVSYEGEDRDWLLGLAERTQLRLDAVSLTIVDGHSVEYDAGFWGTDLGQRYMNLQRELVHRDVQIRRVFVVDRADRLGSAAFREILSVQMEIGVQVRILTPPEIPATLRGSLCDFIVFDDTVCYQSIPSQQVYGGFAPTLTTRLLLEPRNVAERRGLFRELWESASPPAAVPAPAGRGPDAPG